jgi:hypothetical protein
LGSAFTTASENGGDEADPAVAALASGDLDDPPRSHRPEHPRAHRPEHQAEHPPSRAHLEDDFFARGDEISVPPSLVDAHEDEIAPRRVPASVLARRARMRRIVGSGVACAAALTALVVVRALWATRPAAPPADSVLSVRNVVVPSIAIAAQEPARTASPDPAPAEAAPDPTPVYAAQEPRVLPVIEIELPAPSDVATERTWQTAAESLAARDFSGADKAFAELGRRSDPPTRETARLARAMWWMQNGKAAEVRPVLADLAANATTPYVQRHARDLLRTN